MELLVEALKAAVPALFLAAVVWTVQVSGPAEDSKPSKVRGPRGYAAPVERTPDILCGCTDVLKNFASARSTGSGSAPGRPRRA